MHAHAVAVVPPCHWQAYADRIRTQSFFSIVFYVPQSWLRPLFTTVSLCVDSTTAVTAEQCYALLTSRCAQRIEGNAPCNFNRLIIWRADKELCISYVPAQWAHED
eukprot:6925-Heterococcus_DN1.PRE.2